MKTVLLCLDAYKEAYLQESGFFRRFYRTNQHGLVVPTFGYSAMTSALTGSLPDEHGILASFKFTPEGLDFFYHWRFLDQLPGRKIAKLLVTIAYNLVRQLPFSHQLVNLHEIPWRDANRLEFTQLFSLLDPRSGDGPSTLISQLEQEGLKISGYVWPYLLKNGRLRADPLNLSLSSLGTDKRAFKIMLRLLKEPHDLYFFEFFETDSAAHRYGTNSAEVKRVIAEYDVYLEEIAKRCDRLLIFSDHGMVEVEKTINILSQVERLGLKRGRDYLMFLDSTLARFKILSPKAKKLEEYLRCLSEGHILSKDELRHWHVPDGFGDLIWLADPGRLICPNYFSATPVRAMHSYAPNVAENKGIYALSGPRRRKNIQITEIYSLTQQLVKGT